MGKYELAVVVNAQIDDEARTAVVDRCKELITRFGGTVSAVQSAKSMTGARRNLLMRSRR